MGFEDRDWNRSEPSGAGRFFSRVFENVENPLGWSLKLFRFRGITTRIHVIFVLYLLIEPLSAINRGAMGLGWFALAMGLLFLLVTLHEFGHCFACRRVGGEADRIVLLPWGGLALTMPPDHWRAHLVTTLGGPLVNAALAPVFAIAMVAAGMASSLLFDPLDPGLAIGAIAAQSSAVYWVKVGVFWLYYINFVLLAFNVLLPFFPLDGGRIVLALLWKRKGYRKAMEITTLIGFAGAGALLVVGLAAQDVFLVVIAAIGGVSCYAERQRARAEFEIVGDAGPTVFRPDGQETHYHVPQERDRGPTKRELQAQQKAEADERTLDELLVKIREQGMGSLSKKEKATLDRLSEQRRGG